MQLSKERIQEFKALLEEKKGGEVSWEEATEGAHQLVGLVELLLDMAAKEDKRKKRLEESPKGFHLDGIGYTCSICGNSISNEDTWYDKWGIKCLICQKAIDKKIVPQKACRDRDSWYAMWELNSRFGIKTQTALKKIREGELNARIIKNEVGKPHFYIFMKKDNPELKVVEV